jgi:hypothetical protein
MREGMVSSRRRPLVPLAVASLARTGSALALGSCLLLPACTSNAPEPAAVETKTDPSRAIELRYRALSKNLVFCLVNASHTARTELYSSRQPLDQATTKVSPDAVVDATVERFRDLGFFDIATRGRAPSPPPQGATQILEVSLPDGPWHAVMRPGVSTDFVKAFQTCAKSFLDIYNNTMQFQAVDEAPDWSGSGTSSKRNGG